MTTVDIDTAFTKLYSELISVITGKKVSIMDAMTLIVCGIKLVDKYTGLTGKQKSDILVKVLESLAKGKDGTFGTDDDIVSESVWLHIQTLIKSGIIQSTINVCHSLIKGDFPSIEEAQKQAFGCFSILTKSFKH
jgi:hypothetical protein